MQYMQYSAMHAATHVCGCVAMEGSCLIIMHVQAQQDCLAEKIEETSKLIQAAHSRYAGLQRQLLANSNRNVDAATNIAAIHMKLAQTIPNHPQPPAAPSGVTSATYLAARACLREPPSKQNAHASAAVAAMPTPPPCMTPQAKPTGKLVRMRRGTGARRPADSMHGRARPLSSFRASAVVSCADLHAAANPSARLVDFQKHGITELIQVRGT